MQPPPRAAYALALLLATVSAAQEQVYLLGAEARNNSDFGRAVADAGDVDLDGVPDVAVGSPFDDGNGFAAGRVFVYSGRTGDLLWDFGSEYSGDLFGWSVDGVGDLTGDGRGEILVGAPGWDNDGQWSAYGGGVYVLSGTGTHWIASFHYNQLNAQLGYEVRGLGDITGDGIGDFALGVPYDDRNGLTDNGYVSFWSGAGTSFLFSRTGTENGGLYGYSIDVVRATGSQATSRIMVGSPGANVGGPDRGMALLLDGFGNTMSLFAGSTNNEWLGASVAGLGDVDGDGWEDYAFGSPYADVLGIGNDAGLVKVYSGGLTAFLYSFTGATAGANMGASLAGAGDFDGDGYDDVLAGAPNDDSGTVDGGEARLVSGWTGLAMHSWTGGVNDHMGRDVSPAGDLNGDGYGDVVIGANDAPFGAGEAYVRLGAVEAPAPYCTGKVNSQGCTAYVGTEGVPSLSIADGFRVTASDVINKKNGLLFWGYGPDSKPWWGGTLCVAVPLKRTPVQNSGGSTSGADCTGTMSFTFSHAYMASKGIQAGDEIHAQFWYRDPADPSSGVGLSNAVAFDVVP